MIIYMSINILYGGVLKWQNAISAAKACPLVSKYHTLTDVLTECGSRISGVLKPL